MKRRSFFLPYSFILTIFLCSVATAMQAQGIEFMHNLDSAFAKAKAEKKMVFVDFYTSWCGPCKVLASQVFPQQQAGDYFNANFINCKVQCDDKGAGEIIGKKYSVNAYPTLMFLDGDGNTIHSTAGVPDCNELIELAKTAQDPNRNQLSMVHQWESGNRDHAFMLKYFGVLIGSYRNQKATTEFETYFSQLDKSKKISNETFELIRLVKSAPFSAPFEYIEANKKAFGKKVGENEIDSFIAKSYLWYFKGTQLSGQINRDLTKFNAEMEKFRAKKYPYYQEYAEFYAVFDSKDSNGKDDINEYMRRGTAFLEKYGKKNDSYAVALSQMLGNWTGGKDKGIAGIQWMEELLSRNRDPRFLNTYLYILWRNHHWDKAIEVGNEIKESLTRNGKETEDIEKQIEQIKGYKIRYAD